MIEYTEIYLKECFGYLCILQVHAQKQMRLILGPVNKRMWIHDEQVWILTAPNKTPLRKTITNKNKGDQRSFSV